MARMSKSEKALKSARSSAAKVRAKVRQSRGTMVRRGSMAASGYLYGRTEGRSRGIVNVPYVGAVPREVVGLFAYLGAMNTSGATSDALEGAGDASLTLAAYKYGGRAAGVSGMGSSSIAQLEADMQDQIDDVIGALEDDYYGDDEFIGEAEDGTEFVGEAEFDESEDEDGM